MTPPPQPRALLGVSARNPTIKGLFLYLGVSTCYNTNAFPRKCEFQMGELTALGRGEQLSQEETSTGRLTSAHQPSQLGDTSRLDTGHWTPQLLPGPLIYPL